jgi:hypothetical protein
MAIMDQDGEWEVLVLPITHSPPPEPADAIEIPVPLDLGVTSSLAANKSSSHSVEILRRHGSRRRRRFSPAS